MGDHYYTQKPRSASEQHTWETMMGEEPFVFTTDRGVFSKTQVDYGSRVLMDTAMQTAFVSGPLLDLGCGYGPIGLYLAYRCPDRLVHLVDINERALNLAQINATQNKIDNVSIYQSDRYDAIVESDFAGILINPPIRAGKRIVHEMIEGARDHLTVGGKLLIVIQKKQGAPSAKKKMQAVFGNVERIALSKGYWILESMVK